MSLGWWSDDQRSRWKASRLNERMMSLTFNVTCAWNSSTHRPSHCACPYLWRTLVDSRHINQQTSLKIQQPWPQESRNVFFSKTPGCAGTWTSEAPLQRELGLPGKYHHLQDSGKATQSLLKPRDLSDGSKSQKILHLLD